MTPRKVESDLLSNAVDSLHHAIYHSAPLGDEPTGADYKRAILDVARSVELLLKSAWREHTGCIPWEERRKISSLDAATMNVDGPLPGSIRLWPEGYRLTDRILL